MSDALEWPKTLWLLHPEVKTFGQMVSNPDRKEYVLRSSIQPLIDAEQAKTAKLLEALKAAEAWIVDGGYLDDKDPYTAESAASIYEQTRAAIKEAGQ